MSGNEHASAQYGPMDTYTHVVPALQRDAADRMHDMFDVREASSWNV